MKIHDSHTNQAPFRDAKTLCKRIWLIIPNSQHAFLKLLGLLEVELTSEVETAAVTLGVKSRLRLNPDFLERHCQTDAKLRALVMHELFHIMLGHTRLFERITTKQNIAFDAVINAYLSRLFPDAPSTALFRELYHETRMPEALLRPPENWGHNHPSWKLTGSDLQLHKALYSDVSTTYEELFKMLNTHMSEDATVPPRESEQVDPSKKVAPDGSYLKRLLGDHGEKKETPTQSEAERTLREIIAKWPAQKVLSGRDLGSELNDATLQIGDADQSTVNTIRCAAWPLLDLGTRGQGVRRARLIPGESQLPFQTTSDRRAAANQACGLPTLFYRSRPLRRMQEQMEKVHIYLDVSGSMMGSLHLMYAALVPLQKWLHHEVHGFSTEVHAHSFADLKAGKVQTHYGTCIACVTEHMIEHRVRRALILTDGWVGEIPQDHLQSIRRMKGQINIILTESGDGAFAEMLQGKIFTLTTNKETS
jgi:hypothetical protein